MFFSLQLSILELLKEVMEVFAQLLYQAKECWKDDFHRHVMKKFPEALDSCVSHTTRGPREGETDGVNYSFIDDETFKNMIEQKQFIEHGQIAGDSYGTSIEAVSAVRKLGKVCIQILV